VQRRWIYLAEQKLPIINVPRLRDGAAQCNVPLAMCAGSSRVDDKRIANTTHRVDSDA